MLDSNTNKDVPVQVVQDVSSAQPEFYRDTPRAQINFADDKKPPEFPLIRQQAYENIKKPVTKARINMYVTLAVILLLAAAYGLGSFKGKGVEIYGFPG